MALYSSFVGTHIHSSELYMGGWRISGSLYVYDTLNIIHKDAQRHQMHDSHWRPQTLAQSLMLTHLNIRTHASEYIQTHSCMHVLFRPRKMEMHSHTWNWIFVLETPSVSYTDPHALKSPISNVMQARLLSSAMNNSYILLDGLLQLQEHHPRAVLILGRGIAHFERSENQIIN